MPNPNEKHKELMLVIADELHGNLDALIQVLPPRAGESLNVSPCYAEEDSHTWRACFSVNHVLPDGGIDSYKVAVTYDGSVRPVINVSVDEFSKWLKDHLDTSSTTPPSGEAPLPGESGESTPA